MESSMPETSGSRSPSEAEPEPQQLQQEGIDQQFVEDEPAFGDEFYHFEEFDEDPPPMNEEQLEEGYQNMPPMTDEDFEKAFPDFVTFSNEFLRSPPAAIAPVNPSGATSGIAPVFPNGLFQMPIGMEPGSGGNQGGDEEEATEAQGNGSKDQVPPWDSSIADPQQARKWLSDHGIERPEPREARPANDDLAAQYPNLLHHSRTLYNAISAAPSSSNPAWSADQRAYFAEYQFNGMKNVKKALSTTDDSKNAQSQCILTIAEAVSLHETSIIPFANKQSIDASLKFSERVARMIECVQIKHVGAKVLSGDKSTISALVQDPKALLTARIDGAKNNAGKWVKNNAGAAVLKEKKRTSQAKEKARPSNFPTPLTSGNSMPNMLDSSSTTQVLGAGTFDSGSEKKRRRGDANKQSASFSPPQAYKRARSNLRHATSPPAATGFGHVSRLPSHRASFEAPAGQNIDQSQNQGPAQDFGELQQSQFRELQSQGFNTHDSAESQAFAAHQQNLIESQAFAAHQQNLTIDRNTGMFGSYGPPPSFTSFGSHLNQPSVQQPPMRGQQNQGLNRNSRAGMQVLPAHTQQPYMSTFDTYRPASSSTIDPNLYQPPVQPAYTQSPVYGQSGYGTQIGGGNENNNGQGSIIYRPEHMYGHPGASPNTGGHDAGNGDSARFDDDANAGDSIDQGQ